MVVTGTNPKLRFNCVPFSVWLKGNILLIKSKVLLIIICMPKLPCHCSGIIILVHVDICDVSVIHVLVLKYECLFVQSVRLLVQLVSTNKTSVSVIDCQLSKQIFFKGRNALIFKLKVPWNVPYTISCSFFVVRQVSALQFD